MINLSEENLIKHLAVNGNLICDDIINIECERFLDEYKVGYIYPLGGKYYGYIVNAEYYEKSEPMCGLVTIKIPYSLCLEWDGVR